MKTTATLNVNNTGIKWRGIANHVRHNPKQHHQNTDINFDLTKYNFGGNVTKKIIFERLYKNDDRLQKYIKEHDTKAIAGRHSNRVWGNIDNWLKKQHSTERTAVMTLGNVDVKAEMLGKLKMSMEDYCKLSGEALKAYVHDFNHRYSGKDSKHTFAVKHYYVNVDEGSPHVHFDIIPFGWTNGKKPRPSTNFNTALATEFGYDKTAKELLSEFRNVEDHKIVECFNKTLQKHGYDLKLELTRTKSSLHDVPMQAYKDLKKNQKKVEKEAYNNQQYQGVLDEYNDKLAEKAAALDQRDAELRKREAKLKAEQKEVNDAITNVYNDFNNISLQLAWQSSEEDMPKTMAIIKKHIDNHDCDFARDEQNKPLFDKQGNPKMINSKGFFGDLFSQAVIICERLGQNIVEKVKEHMKSWEDIMNQKYQENLKDLQEHQWQPRTHNYHASQHQNDDSMGL